MNNNAPSISYTSETSSKKIPNASRFINELLFIAFSLFFAFVISITYEIWNVDDVNVSLLNANFETLGWENSVYAWFQEGNPLVVNKVDNPDIENKQCLSLLREPRPGWSGIGKPIILHSTPSINDILTIQIKNNSKSSVLISFEIQEATADSHPVSEVWDVQFNLESDRWETIEIPLSTLNLKNYYQPEGKAGNEIFDLWPLSQFGFVFSPDTDVDILLDSIQLSARSFSKLPFALLLTNLLWWVLIFQFILRKRFVQNKKSIVFCIELSKFSLYQLALIASPNRSDIAVALCILCVYNLIESMYALNSNEKDGFQRHLIRYVSPVLANIILMLYAPSWPMKSLIIAAHCFQIMENRKKHALEGGVLCFILIFVFNSYILGDSIRPIPAAGGLIAIFCLHYVLSSYEQFLVREKAQIEIQTLYEQQIQHNQKMESISQVTRGISHEFNNLLTGIIGNLKMMQMRKNQDVSGFIQNANESAQRAAELIKKLQMYGRLSYIQPKESRLNVLLHESISIFHSSLQKNIELKTTVVCEDEEPISIDPMRVKIVFMNLLMNARDAIIAAENEGLCKDYYIEVSSAVVNVAKRDDEDVSHPPGKYAVVTIADNGIGMDSNTLQKAFDPFYSTKEISISAGLGLSCAYGIVKEHRGWIDAVSEPGAGTTFRIYFPFSSSNEKDAQ